MLPRSAYVVSTQVLSWRSSRMCVGVILRSHTFFSTLFSLFVERLWLALFSLWAAYLPRSTAVLCIHLWASYLASGVFTDDDIRLLHHFVLLQTARRKNEATKAAEINHLGFVIIIQNRYRQWCWVLKIQYIEYINKKWLYRICSVWAFSSEVGIKFPEANCAENKLNRQKIEFPKCLITFAKHVSEPFVWRS